MMGAQKQRKLLCAPLVKLITSRTFQGLAREASSLEVSYLWSKALLSLTLHCRL